MKQVIFKNKKILYNTSGEGKPVMLLHGFAENSRLWNYQVEELKEKFYVIVPDIPGSGHSEMLEGIVTIEDYAEVIKAIADEENIDSVHNTFTLIGHSMGGYIALAFAEKYPGLLNGFGLFHSSAFADDAAKIDGRKKGIEFIKNNGALSFLKTSVPNLFSTKTKKEFPGMVENLLELSKDFTAASLIQYNEAMMQRPDRTAVLQSFNRPVLFIIGKDDNAVPLKASLQQCHIPAISYILILENSGHMGMWEEKEKSTGFLLKYLQEL